MEVPRAMGPGRALYLDVGGLGPRITIAGCQSLGGLVRCFSHRSPAKVRGPACEGANRDTQRQGQKGPAPSGTSVSNTLPEPLKVGRSPVLPLDLHSLMFNDQWLPGWSA